MTYFHLDQQLSGRCAQRRKVDNHTYLERRENDVIALKLHATDILHFHKNGNIVLNTGGWQTVTTRDRMNKFLPKSMSIFTEKRIWYVGKGNTWDERRNNPAIYRDGMVVNWRGVVSGAGDKEEAKKKRVLMKQINQYAKDYMDALFRGEVPAPSGGDCWGCCMHRVDGDGIDHPFGPDHLLDHIEERYYVPSLLVNAIKYKPISQVARWVLSAFWSPAPVPPEDVEKLRTAPFYTEIAQDQMGKSLRRYLYHSLNIGD